MISNPTDGLLWGAVVASGVDAVEIVNSTVSLNQGGVWVDSTNLVVSHSTIDANPPSTGLHYSGGAGNTLLLENTILSANDPDCSIVATNYAHVGNLSSDSSCGLDPSAGELPDTDPHARRTGVERRADHDPPAQRRQPRHRRRVGTAGLHRRRPARRARPEDGNGDGVVACDIGAVEVAALIFVDTFEAWTTVPRNQVSAMA